MRARSAEMLRMVEEDTPRCTPAATSRSVSFSSTDAGDARRKNTAGTYSRAKR
jgi:hypothetical protein